MGREEAGALRTVTNGRNLFRVKSPYLEVEAFEKEWAQKTGVKYALCVTGGTRAFICGFIGMGMEYIGARSPRNLDILKTTVHDGNEHRPGAGRNRRTCRGMQKKLVKHYKP